MWGHAASLYSFGLPRPQVLFHRAAPCQYPSRPSLYRRFLPSWMIWHLSLLRSHRLIPPPIIFSNFYQLLHFQSVKHHRASPLSVQLEFSLCWVTVIFPDTMYSWSLFRISLMWQPGSSTNTRLLQVRTWSPTMSAFRLPPEPCWEQGLLFPRCSCLTFPNQKAAKIKDVCTV